VAEVWQKYKNKNIDCIVLDCTHYTLIKPEIQKIVGSPRSASDSRRRDGFGEAGKDIKIIDSNKAVAKQVKRVYSKIRRE